MENGEPDSARPSWMPPDDVLAAIVPVGQFLIRAERVIVALSHLSVYPNGCMLEVRASAHGHDAARDVWVPVRGHSGTWDEAIGAGVLVVR